MYPSTPIHLPAPSYFPFVMAIGLPLVFYGVIYHTTAWGKALIVIGVLVMMSSLIGWSLEPVEEPLEDHNDGIVDPEGASV